MTGGVRDEELGVFTAGELRAGGINRRGFLQPILPGPEGVDAQVESRAAAEGLASRGLLVRRGSGWRPVGRFERVLEAAAAGRSLLAVESAPTARGAAPAPPRLVFGCLGRTGEALDLQPRPGGYRIRLLARAAAAAEVVGTLGLPSQDVEEVEPTSDADPGWGRVEELLGKGVTTVRVEAASIDRPEGPLVQHRLAVMSTPAGEWLLLGRRQGARAGRAAAPATVARAQRVLVTLLSGADAASL